MVIISYQAEKVKQNLKKTSNQVDFSRFSMYNIPEVK